MKDNIIPIFQYDSIKSYSEPVGGKFDLTDAITLIKHYEGCKLTAYKDGGGVWTIGYGNTYYENGVPVKQGDKITQSRADQLFNNTINAFSVQVLNEVSGLLQHQIAALVSFSYNVGLNSFRESTLLRVIKNNKYNYDEIKHQFSRWKYDNGRIVQGLINRRRSEYYLYAFGKVEFFN